MTSFFRISPRGTSQRFNFRKTNWDKFREGFEKNDLENEWDGSKLEEILEKFSLGIKEAANQSIPKVCDSKTKSYPGHIIELIKMRKEVRQIRKKGLVERVQLNTEYNRLTDLIKLNIKQYTEEKWKVFLDKLGPYPASTSVFWQIINRARASKTYHRFRRLRWET